MKHLQHLLRRLRLVILSYAAAFALTLLLLAGGLFLLIQGQIASELDRSLEDLSAATFRAARILIGDGYEPVAALGAAVDALAAPDRGLYLFAPDGSPLPRQESLDPRIVDAAIAARTENDVWSHFRTASGQRWRLHAARWDVSRPFVLVALVDASMLERQSARLIELFVMGGLIALLLLAAGSYGLIRMAGAPLEASVEQMRRFTADAAHELRTPVAVIRGRTEVALQRERPAADYIAMLDEIAIEAERLSHIVDDLLTLARADAGGRTIQRQRIFLDDIASDVMSAAGVLARGRHVRLELRRYEEAPILGDPTLVRQLVMILLDNAIKFTPENGGVRVDAFVDANYSCLVVEDDGIGIAAEHLPRVFERFYRADAGREHARGAGLGLSIARWIADVHHARIEIESESGRGTRASVRFSAAP